MVCVDIERVPKFTDVFFPVFLGATPSEFEPHADSWCSRQYSYGGNLFQLSKFLGRSIIAQIQIHSSVIQSQANNQTSSF